MRLAQAGLPDRLSPSDLDPVTGRISWPSGLLNDVYAAEREQVDQLFADRALAHGAIGPQMHAEITDAVDAMLAKLKSLIKDYNTNQYIASRNFLNSLAYEASAPTPGLFAHRRTDAPCPAPVAGVKRRTNRPARLACTVEPANCGSLRAPLS